MNLEMPILVKKAGKSKTLGKESRKAESKPKFKFNKKGRFIKNEEKEVHRTSKNIFDWFNVKNEIEIGRLSDIKTGKLDTTTIRNGPSSFLQVMIGQNKGSPSNIPVIDCCWGQDEHLLLNRAGKGDDELGGEVDVGGVLIVAEGHQDTPGGQ